MAYVVKKGDTLSKIASQNGLTLAQLLELNPQYKSNPNLVNIGASVNTTKAVSSTPTKTATGSFDLSKVKTNSSGMVQTGPYTFVSADSLGAAGYAQALAFAGTAAPSTSNPPTTTSTATKIVDDSAARLTALEASPEFKSLTSGEQAAIKAIGSAIETNDTQKADLLKRAFESAGAKADPIYKQTLKLATNELTRGFAKIDDDLAYNENKLTTQLQDLRNTISAQKGLLTLEQEAELKSLERDYSQKLETTVQDLAAAGFTDSSRRMKSEEILAQTKGDLVESSKRKFGEASRKLDVSGETQTRDTQAEIERLRKLSTESKTNLGRAGEANIGTKNLPDLNYNALGDITGKADQQRQADIDKAALDMYQMGFVM